MTPDQLTPEALGLRADLDVAPIYAAAQQTAAVLRISDSAQVAFAPGDATQYQLLIVRPRSELRAGSMPWYTSTADEVDGALIVVPLNLPGSPIVWQPMKTSPAQIEGRHRLTDHEHTAEVYAAFLTLLAAADEGVCPECGSPDPDERLGGDDPGLDGEGTQCQHDWHWR